MKLFLKSHIEKLKANMEVLNTTDKIPRPVVKLFNPCGAATWLICAMEEVEGDTILWGYADLGMQCVEFGTISLNEIQSLRLPMGLKIERDLHWKDNPEINWLDKDSLAGC